MTRRALALACVALVAGFVALGIWQVRRRGEKVRLIAQVEARAAAPAVAAPGRPDWIRLGPNDAYRRIVATGRYRRGTDTRVQAVTVLGGGTWIVTPLDTGRFTVLVNRGFVPAEHRGPVPPPTGVVVVRGLLRLSEPGGAFLRANAPAADRWTSRDVAAIAARRGVGGPVAPYFIDAEAGPSLPVGGLTVVRFANNHLVYALTWFAMAATVAALGWRALGRRATRGCDPNAPGSLGGSNPTEE